MHLYTKQNPVLYSTSTMCHFNGNKKVLKASQWYCTRHQHAPCCRVSHNCCINELRGMCCNASKAASSTLVSAALLLTDQLQARTCCTTFSQPAFYQPCQSLDLAYQLPCCFNGCYQATVQHFQVTGKTQMNGSRSEPIQKTW
jgi:hypothetical protein